MLSHVSHKVKKSKKPFFILQKKLVFIQGILKIISVEGNKDVPENQTSA